MMTTEDERDLEERVLSILLGDLEPPSRPDRGRTRILVEHPSGARVCVHEGPAAETRMEREARMGQEACARRLGHLGFIRGQRTRPVG